MELYLIRHGETEFNKHHQLMGQRIDAPLDATGLAQANEVVAKLPEDLAAIYSSPLQRARQTGEVVARHFHMDLAIRPELTERDFGSLSGKTWDEIDKQTGLSLSERDANLEYDYSPYGGESVFSVKNRLQKFLEEIQDRHQGQKIAAVTHYGIISIMNGIFHRQEHHKLSNTSVHKYVI